MLMRMCMPSGFPQELCACVSQQEQMNRNAGNNEQQSDSALLFRPFLPADFLLRKSEFRFVYIGDAVVFIRQKSLLSGSALCRKIQK